MPRVAPVRGGALRISEVVGEGDPTRRASTRLVVAGLDSADSERALSQYERAIQIDATNPYAYLAVAAYEIQWGDVARGRQFLSQARLLLESEERNSPRVEPHLTGLSGRARVRGGDAQQASRGEMSLERARSLAPEVWGDGWLTPAELR